MYSSNNPLSEIPDSPAGTSTRGTKTKKLLRQINQSNASVDLLSDTSVVSAASANAKGGFRPRKLPNRTPPQHCDELLSTSQHNPQGGASNIEDDFGSLSLYGHRRIQFSGFPDTFVSQMGKEIATSLRNKIRKERKWGTAYQVQLCGWPWGWTLRRVDICVRIIFNVMHKEGYEVQTSNHIQSQLGTYYFKKSHIGPKARCSGCRFLS
jgi:hypothetical protein